MEIKVLLRRSSEYLAAAVIIISILVYTFAAVFSVRDQAEPGSDASSSNIDGQLQAAASNHEEIPLTKEINPNEKDQTGDIHVPAVNPANESNANINDSNTSIITDMPIEAAPDNTADATSSANNTGEPVQGGNETQNSGTDIPPSVNSDEKTDSAEPAQKPIYKYVQTNSLNVRSGPGSDNKKLATLAKGDRIQVLQQCGEEWLEIMTPDNLRGFVFAEYTGDTIPPIYKYVTVNAINLRSGAGSDTEKLGTLPKGSRVQVLENVGEWLSVITPDNKEAYVFAEYVSDTAPVVYNYVSSNKLNVRKGPSSDTEKLTTLEHGDRVQFLENKGDWCKIKTSNNIEGYVFAQYVTTSPVQVSRSDSSAQSYNSDLATKILNYAKEYVGVKYVHGGKSPKGFDCSGFTWYVFDHFGIELPRSAAEYSNVGTKISRSEIKPGDLLLYDRYDNWSLGHVGIYLGNDKFIHASSSKGKVVIDTLSNYNGNLLGIRRVLK